MAAFNDFFAITENQTLNGNLFDNNGGGSADFDSDMDGVLAILTFEVNGQTYAAGVTVNLGSGASLTVNSDGSFTLIPGTLFDNLAAGDSEPFIFAYTNDDGESALATVTIDGVNDAPVAHPGVDSVLEDESTSFALSVTDVDDAIVSYTVVGEAPTGLSYDTNTGAYTFDASSHDDLAEGETRDVTFDFYGTDAFGVDSNTQTQTITITGVNDAPVAEVGGTSSGDEDATISGSVSATDVDNGAVLTYSTADALITMATDGSFTFDASGYDSLADGDSDTYTFSFTADDGNGGTDTQTHTITINGVNDAPVAEVGGTSSGDEDATISGSVSATDADNGGVLTYSTADALITMDPDGSFTFDASGYDSLADGDSDTYTFSFSADDGNGGTDTQTHTITINGANDAPVTGAASTMSVDEDVSAASFVFAASDVDGTIASYQLVDAAPTGLTFTPDGGYVMDASSYDYLADGETAELVVSFTATDNSGATSAPQTLTITITGTNDAPTVSAVVGSVDEDGSTGGNVSASDVDDAIASYELTGEVPTGFSINAATGEWAFDASSYDYLADGAEEEVTADYTVTDEFGDTSTSTITVTVTGTNDAPVASDSSASVDEDDAVFNGSVSATDADDGAVLTYQLIGEEPEGLTFNSDGTYSFDASSFGNMSEGEYFWYDIAFTATDAEGGVSDEQNLRITVTGSNDAPVVSAATGTATEGRAASGMVPAATDADFDGTIVSYQLAEPAPAGFVLNSNGTWTFSGEGFDSLTAGQTADLVVNYTATDEDGLTSAPQTLTITVTGIAGTSGNDTIIGTAGDDTLEGGAGTDNIYGGLGNDTFIGNVDGVGDAYRGEGGSDTVDYSAATGAMNINLNNAASGGGVGTDQLYSIENTIATAFNDTISGNASDNRIVSGLGNDTVNGNGGVDTVVINANATGGIATQGAFNLTVTTADGMDTMRNVEFLQFNNATIRLNGVTGNAYAYGVADTNTATEDGAATEGNVLANDIEIENEAMTVSTAGTIVGAHGTLIINANGTYTYLATDQSLAEGETVSDVFSYTVVDSAGEGSSASLTFTVTGANDAPVAADGSNAATEDGMITGSVAATDVDGDVLSYALAGEPVTGLSLNSDGSYSFDASSYELNEGETQDVTFSFTVSDGEGGTDTGSYTITVTGINDSPVAFDASVGVTEDASVSGSVSASDIDGTVASYQLTAEGPTGLTFNTDGSYTFDASSYDGLAVGATQVVTATFTATDDQGAISGEQTLSVTITGTNDVPTVTEADFGILEDTSMSGSVVGADVDGTIATYQLTAEGPTGLTFNSDGTYSFDASSYDSLNEGETTTVSFSYTATDNDSGVSATDTVVITITGTNDLPVATNAVNEVDEDSDINGQLSATDIDGDVVSYQLVGEVPEGLVLNTDGSYSFDAASYDDLADGETRDVIATFTATDDQGDVSATQTLTITVTGSNDAPVVAGADFSIDEDGTMSGSVSGTDVDGTLASYTLVGEAPTGLMFNTDGTYTFDASSYEQNEGESEEVSFTFTGTDNDGGVSDPVTVTITINGINDLPIAANAADAVDEDGAVNGAVSATDADGTIASYQLVGDAPTGLIFNTDGSYSFDAESYDDLAEGETLDVVATFTATDDQGAVSAPRTLTITVTGSNDAPTVSQADFSVNEDASVSGSVSSEDVDGEVVSYTLVGEAPTGLTFNPDGTYVFDASSYDSLNAGDDTTVEFTFTGTDNSGGVSDPVTVTVTVVGQNDAPVAYDDIDEVDEDGEINGSVSASDEDGTVVSYQLVGDAPEGLVFNTDGTYSFDAAEYDYLAEGDTEEVIATFTATDDQGIVSAPQTLTITVTGSNDAPTVSQADFSVTEDASVSGSVSSSDVDGEVVSYALVGEAPTGLAFNTDGTYTFDASSYDSLAAGESTTVEFTFTGTDDSSGVSDPETVIITINGTNDGPVASAATNSVLEDASVSGSVSASDIDSTVASYQLTGEVPTGLTMDTDGAYSFDASSYDSLAAGETRIVTATFTATDDEGAVSAAQTLSITITGTNDAPTATASSGGVTEDVAVTPPSMGGTFTEVEPNTSFATANVISRDAFRIQTNADLDDDDLPSLSISANMEGNNDFGDGSYDWYAITLEAGETLYVDIDHVNNSNDVHVSLYNNINQYLTGGSHDSPDAGNGTGSHGRLSFTAVSAGTYYIQTDHYLSGGDPSYVVNLSIGNFVGVVGTDSATSTLNDSGTVDFGDVDLTDEHTVDAEADGMGYLGTFEVEVGEDSTGDGTGAVNWTFSVDNDAVQYLAAGEVLTQTYTVTIDDGEGGTVEQTVTITITGTNDVPTVSAATNSGNEDDTAINGSVSGSDIDGDVLTYQLVGEGPEGLTFNTDGTYSFDASSYDDLAQGETYDAVFSYTATDSTGAVSSSQTLTITLTGSNDAPVAYDSDVEVGDGDTYEGSVSATDVDGDIVSYQLTGLQPAGLTFNTDGSYEFDASAFDLQLGDSETVTFTFTATDDEGSVSEEQTVTITVIGQPTQVDLDDGGDTFTGTGDDEDIDGGDGDDVVFTGGGINTVDGGDGDDTVTGGSGSDTLNGDGDDDYLNGGSGNDTLDGGTGDDDVNGGSGDDLVYSNVGDDILRGGSGNDTISFENTGAGVSINLTGAGFQMTVDGSDLYQGFENVIGSDFSDTITGNELANTLNGGEGNDTLTGGLGNDTLIGGNGNDTYFVDAGDTIVEETGGGIDRIFTSAATFTLGGNVENIYGQSAAGHTFTGDDGANTMVGAGGNDVLIGGLGADTLLGQAGNDIMYGGTGAANTMIGGLGDDTYYVDANDSIVETAGQGTDTVITTRNTFTLNGNVENLQFSGTGAFTGTGNVLDNAITGGTGNDTLMGGAGNDTLNGGDGVDVARVSGQSSGYSVTREGAGWRIIDTNLGDGNDGSDFLMNMETLRFGNGATLSLAIMEVAPVLTADKGGYDGAQVLPGLADDDFVFSKFDDTPLVLPGSDGFGDVLFGALELSQPGLQADLLVRDGFMDQLLPNDGASHDIARHDDWMM